MALPDPASINAPSLPENSVSDRNSNISVLEFIARGTNLRSKQRPPLTSIGNVIAPPAQEPPADPVIGGVIVHVKPPIDTALLSQDSPQGTTQVLNLISEQQQTQLTSIENPLAPEPQQGPVITGGVIVHVKTSVNTALPSQDSPQGTTQVLSLNSKQHQTQLTSIENPPAPEPQHGPVITGGVIVHVKPFVDTALPSQD